MPYQNIETNKDHSEIAVTTAVFFEENFHQFPMNWLASEELWSWAMTDR